MTYEDDAPTDYELHSTLTDAIRRGDVAVEVDFAKINRNNVPGFRTTDFIVPPFVLIILTAYVSLQFGAVYGIALFAIGAAFFWFYIRPRARKAAVGRVYEFAMSHLEAWNAVWKNGGYRLTLQSDPAIKVAGPNEAWQDFTRRYLVKRTG